MPSRYHPIEDGLWNDSKLEGAPFEEKGFFAFLCSNERQRPSGIYRATDGQIAEDTQIPRKRVVAYLADLQARRLIVRDGAWIFVRTYLKRQPNNERLLIGAKNGVDSCDSIPILQAFAEQYPLYSKWSTDRLETVTKPMNENVSQSSYRAEQSRAEHIPLRLPSEAPWPSPEALALKYNREATDNCPAVTSLSERRRRKALQSLRQFPDEAWWDVTFRQYHRSRFLSGKAPPGNGHGSFVPDFDWLLSVGKDGSENAMKVHDGRYCDAS